MIGIKFEKKTTTQCVMQMNPSTIGTIIVIRSNKMSFTMDFLVQKCNDIGGNMHEKKVGTLKSTIWKICAHIGASVSNFNKFIVHGNRPFSHT